MRRYLLDTNALSDCIFRRRSVDLRVRRATEQGFVLGTGVPAWAELLAGVEYSQSREANLKIVRRNRSLFRLWAFDEPAAQEFARLNANFDNEAVLFRQLIFSLPRFLSRSTIASSLVAIVTLMQFPESK